MKPNPYQSPRDAVAQDPQEGEWFKLRLFFPIAWTLFLIFGPPLVQRIPVGVRVISTIVTIAALAVLPSSVKGWMHLLCVPIYLLLLLFQFLVWTF